MTDILACGVETTSEETKEMLCHWAERILVCADEAVKSQLPLQYGWKMTLFNIGGDRWGNPQNPELLSILDNELKKVGL